MRLNEQRSIMNLERMCLFCEVVKQGSYTKAADLLGVSKGYLSTQIKKLEAETNKQLLVRNTRTMRLTSAGEILFKQASKLPTFLQETQSLLHHGEDGLVGTVKCTAPVGLSTHVLWPIFNDIMSKHSDINIWVDSSNTTHNLVADDFDFAVRITNTPPQDMIAKKLMRFKYVCCATPTYLAQHGEPATPQELQQHKCLVLAHWQFWTFSNAGKTERIDLSGKFTASDNDLLKKAALKHHGIARLPEYMIKDELASGELVALFPNQESEHRDLYLVYPQIPTRPPRVKLCLEAIVDGVL